LADNRNDVPTRDRGVHTSRKWAAGRGLGALASGFLIGS